MEIELHLLVEIDKSSGILKQETDGILDSVMSAVKDLIYDHDELHLKYIDSEIVR
jgi:hypothetical protein